MKRRIKILWLQIQVNRLERAYRRNPSLRNLSRWSKLSGTLYRFRYKPVDLFSGT